MPRVKVEDFRTFQGQGVQGTATPAGGGDPMTVRFGTPEFACALAADAEGLAAVYTAIRNVFGEEVLMQQAEAVRSKRARELYTRTRR